jgi:hypothetical protein
MKPYSQDSLAPVVDYVVAIIINIMRTAYNILQYFDKSFYFGFFVLG